MIKTLSKNMFLVIHLDHERIKIRSRLLLYCSHTLNELSKGKSTSGEWISAWCVWYWLNIEGFERNHVSIQTISFTCKILSNIMNSLDNKSKEKFCLIQKLSFKNRNNVHTSPLHRRESNFEIWMNFFLNFT